jgi:Flp pilus assembly protein TadD
LLLAEAGDVGGGIEHLQRFIALNPRDAEAHYQLGRFLAATGKRDDAAREFGQALKLRPDIKGAKEDLQRLGVKP